MDVSTLQRLARAKLADAELLLSGQRYADAYYLAGYAVELGLKAVVARSFQASVIPDKKFVADIYTHEIKRLLTLSNLQSDLERDMAGSSDLAANWSKVLQWSEASRYLETGDALAADLVSAIADPVN